MIMGKFLLVLSALFIICAADYTLYDPGLRLSFTDVGLTKLLNYVRPQFEETIVKTIFPDMHGYQTVLVGNISYSLTNIKMTQIDMGTFRVASKESDKTITFQTDDASGAMTLSWSWEDTKGLVGDKGTGEITITGLSLIMSMQVGQKGVHPTFKVVGSTCNIRKLDIVLHGGASWFYQVFIDIMGDKIKSMVEVQLSKALADGLNKQLGPTFEKFSLIDRQHDRYVSVDLYLVNDSKIVFDKYLTLPVHGRYVPTDDIWTDLVPFHPKKMPIVYNNQDVQYFSSEALFHSYWATYYKHGDIHGQVTPEQSTIIKLSTATFKKQAPGLFSFCPDCPITLDIAVLSPPSIVCNPGAGITDADLVVHVSVLKDKVSTDVATLNLTASFITTLKPILSGKVPEQDLCAGMDFETYEFAVEVMSSTVGTIDVHDGFMQRAVMALLELGVGPYGSAFIKEHRIHFVALEDFGLEDIKMSIGDGFAVTSYNIKQADS